MTEHETTTRIAFIGAGQMGLPMVRRLAAAGRDVIVYARRQEIRDECVAAGAAATADLREAVGEADAVIVCLFSDAQLLELALGEGGFLASAPTGAMVLIHTTGSPATARTLAERGAARQLRVVEAPVSGSANDIASGHVTVLLGGDRADVEAARHVVAAYGDPILHVGPLGAAQAVKLLNNATLAAHLQLIAEVERIAVEFGVDWPQAVAAIQASSGASRAMGIVQTMGSVHALVEGAGPVLRKDVAAVVEIADQLGIDLGELGRVNREGPLAFIDRQPRP